VLRGSRVLVVARAVPVRSCVGCKARVAKSDLIRIVVVEAGVARHVVPDPRGQRPGRGAHLHPDLACLELAERRRAFPRAFRLAGPLDATEVRAYLETDVG
jgi:predicted RNA-binding protein YlxR (DUF448 family)